MAFTPGERLEIHPKSLLFQEHNSIQSIPARKLLDPMEKEVLVWLSKETNRYGRPEANPSRAAAPGHLGRVSGKRFPMESAAGMEQSPSKIHSQRAEGTAGWICAASRGNSGILPALLPFLPACVSQLGAAGAFPSCWKLCLALHGLIGNIWLS